MTPVITFGTDGWRAVIAEDFTFANLERVALATARHFRRHRKARNGIVIGYDARFLSKEFAQRAAEVIASAGIPVKLADGVSSTPMVSLLTKMEQAAAGVVITASHNPARYSGFKIKGEYGGPAHPELVAKVERELAAVLRLKTLPRRSLGFAELLQKKRVTMVDMTRRYVEDIAAKVDIGRIRRSGLRMLYDAMHGAGQGVMRQLLPEAVEMRGDFNPSFGGANPEPLPQNMADLLQRVPAERFHIGIATDGDADRVGAVDEHGRFVDSHKIFSLLLKYLVQEKKVRGEVVKSLSVTQMVNRQVEKYGLVLHETPIGFKYICRLMTEHDVLIGGEESGGLGVKGHLPERDGILVGLLLCEMLAVRGKSLGGLVAELNEEFGPHECRRVDLHVTEREKAAIMKRFGRPVREVAGLRVTGRQETDGVKLFVEGGWVLVRASGTEPLIRFYAEGRSVDQADALLRAATGR